MKTLILARHTDEETGERLRANAEHLLRTVRKDTDLIGRFTELEVAARWHRQSKPTEAEASAFAEALSRSARFEKAFVVEDPGVPLTAEVVLSLIPSA